VSSGAEHACTAQHMQSKPSDLTKSHWFLIIVRAKTGRCRGCVAETDPMVKPWGDRLLGGMGLALRFGGPAVVTPDLIWCLCEGGAVGVGGGPHGQAMG
jgi:hypothetical protein